MKKLKVVTKTKDQIAIEDIDLKKHLVVYKNFEEILCKCEKGYVFVAPTYTKKEYSPTDGDFNETMEQVFRYHGNNLTVYEL